LYGRPPFEHPRQLPLDVLRVSVSAVALDDAVAKIELWKYESGRKHIYRKHVYRKLGSCACMAIFVCGPKAPTAKPSSLAGRASPPARVITPTRGLLVGRNNATKRPGTAQISASVGIEDLDQAPQ
jgi:hypothetical protein